MLPRTIVGRVAGRIFEPLTDRALASALVLFWAFGALANVLFQRFLPVSPVLAVLGAVLAVFLALPACLRYLLAVLEARVLDRATPPLTTAHLNPADGPWRLAPLAVLAAGAGLHVVLEERWPGASPVLPAVLGIVVLPLVMTQVAVTHSVLAGFNPAGWVRLLERIGARYAIVPGVLLAGVLLLDAARAAGTAYGWLIGGWLYLLALGAALTGRIAASRVTRDDIDVPAALAGPEPESAAERQRVRVLDHAYALVSRGNHDGGLAHLAEHAARSEDPLAAERRFFDAMLGWEDRETALWYAQIHLKHLLDAGHDVAAMKLIARCLMENPRFRPAPDDRERVLAVAARLGNADIGAALRS